MSSKDRMRLVDYLVLFLLLMLMFMAASCYSDRSEIICNEIYQPVCVDGKTYPNACYAQADGYNNSDLVLCDD